MTVLHNGLPIATDIVPVTTYSVTCDRNSSYRRSGNLTFVVASEIPPLPLLPTTTASDLAPFGNEVFVETGLGTFNTPGSVSVLDWIPMGTFAIATTEIQDTGEDMTVTLTLYDRSWTISQRKLLQNYSFPATPSGNFVAEIQALLNMVWSEDPNAQALQYNITPTDAVVPQASYNQGSDPWQAAIDMANAVGYELFFDVNGVVTGYPVPVPANQPITWNFTDSETAVFGDGGATGGGGSTALLGSAYSTPVAVTSTMTRDGIYNRVAVTGVGSANTPPSNTGTSASVVATAADTNPASPTYVNGGMGTVPEFVSSNLATTSVQAQTMANNDLQTALASTWQLTITVPPMHFLEVDDVVTVSRPRIGLNAATMVIDSMNWVTSYADTSTITGRVISS